MPEDFDQLEREERLIRARARGAASEDNDPQYHEIALDFRHRTPRVLFDQQPIYGNIAKH
jgi:hypothetical protein